jgi:hypothetical protein
VICRAGRSGQIDLLRIERLLAERAISMHAAARQYQISRDALMRHWHGISVERKNFLLFGRKLHDQALAAAAAEEKLAGLDHLRIARASAHRGLARAVELGDLGQIASLSRQVAEISKDILKMSGEWRDDPKNVTNIAVVNLPAIAPVISGIARALAPFPEARQAVAAFLRTQNALPTPEARETMIDAAAG